MLESKAYWLLFPCAIGCTGYLFESGLVAIPCGGGLYIPHGGALYFGFDQIPRFLSGLEIIQAEEVRQWGLREFREMTGAVSFFGRITEAARIVVGEMLSGASQGKFADDSYLAQLELQQQGSAENLCA